MVTNAGNFQQIRNNQEIKRTKNLILYIEVFVLKDKIRDRFNCLIKRKKYTHAVFKILD